MRITLKTGVAVLAAAVLYVGPAQAQMPRIALRGGMAVPKGDYDQTTEGLDMFARVGWTAGAELRFYMTDNLGVYVSYDRISNPVDEEEVRSTRGTLNPLSAENHVAQMTMAGLRVEGELTPDATLALHGGVGLAVFRPGSLSEATVGSTSYASDQQMSLAGGFSITVRRVEAAFRFYPLGTFHHGGTFDSGDERIDAAPVSAPVHVMTLTLGYTFL